MLQYSKVYFEENTQMQESDHVKKLPRRVRLLPNVTKAPLKRLTMSLNPDMVLRLQIKLSST